MNERWARIFAGGLVLGLLLAIWLARGSGLRNLIEVHAAIPEQGGWSPTDLSVAVGEPLHLRLVSDDVMHGFAVGQTDWPAIDLKPGQPVEVTLSFEKPGKYTFYCTRWCGVNHWRMRGTIEVTGSETQAEKPVPPLYVTLNLDLDAPHIAEVTPGERPSAKRGAALAVEIPARYLAPDYYQTHSPAQAWKDLRGEDSLKNLDDAQVWDLVALAWASQTTPAGLEEGRELYASNCAACHGESGAGDGVMAGKLDTTIDQPAPMDQSHAPPSGHETIAPANFTDPSHMLGASPAILQGKMVRGGMGTGMPYWGPIFTEEQLWNLVSYLWTFQFDDMEVK